MKYTIEGGSLPVAIVTLDRGESIITEGGAMSWMSSDLTMETTSLGGAKKVLGRLLAGESLFVNKYMANSNDQFIALSSSMPGRIVGFDITPTKGIIIQKQAFLACDESVDLSMAFNNKMSTGFFAGEGFIMQRLSGYGTALCELDGYIKEYELGYGQQLVLNTGYLAAMEDTCEMTVKKLSGLKNILLGGEGLFNTVVTGPGKVWVQSMPIANLAERIIPYMPKPSNSHD